MRDIKFRAWNTKGIIYSGKTDIKFYIEAKSGKPYTINSYAGKESEIVLLDWVLMQYTGLKDKNSVEMYEGDVLDVLTPGRADDYRGVIEYEHGGFWVMTEVGEKGEGWCFPDMVGLYSNWNFVVIGNIYENPELLETTL